MDAAYAGARPLARPSPPTISASATRRRRTQLQRDPRSAWASTAPRTCSTAAPAATTPASTTPSPSTPAWPTPTCACPTPSSSCATPYNELEESHQSLESAKEALVKREKLASMGQLAAGIAHEVNNPLGILLLHANLLLEECDEGAPGGRRPGDHRRPGQPLQAHHLRPAQLRPPEPGGAPAHRPAPSWSTRSCAPCPPRRTSRVDVRGPPGRPGRRDRRATRSSRCSPTCSPTPSTPCPSGGTIAVTVDDTDDERPHPVSDTGIGIPKETHGQAVRPVLHHQAGGHGHRPRPGGHPRHRQDAPRPDHRGVQRRPGRGPTGTTFTIALPRHETERTSPQASRRSGADA